MAKKASVPLIDLKAQLRPLKARILKGWASALDTGTFINGPAVQAFEAEAAKFAGARFAIACNSGTDALYILLRALGVGPGDEVLVPAFSFFATAEAVSLVGAKPVFCDIRADDFLLDLNEVRAKLSDRSKAVIPVHLFGLPMDLRPLKELCKGRNIKILEDTAQAFGARTPEGMAGACGDAGALSFYPTKNLNACGDAGLMLTNDPETARLARELKEHGSPQRYVHRQIGYNSRMDELQAIALRIKLPLLRKWNAARAKAAASYAKGLAGLPLVLPMQDKACVWHQYTVRVSGGRRDQLKAHLAKLGIASAVFYPEPMHVQTPYAASAPHLKVAESAGREVLSLPMFAEIKPAQLKAVVDGIKSFYAGR
jgi:dTDP-4-amino-4,6-dideoxygalactose transaminase